MNASYCPLEGDTLIHLRGQRISEFLQGQLTADMRSLTQQVALLAAFCNPQGRVLADLLVLQLSGEHCVMRTRRAIAEQCATALAKYAQFSRIDVAVDDDGYRLFGIWGPEAETLAGTLGFALPAEPAAVSRVDGRICYRNAAAMLEVVVPGSCLQEQQGILADAGDPQSETHWRGQELRQGIYRIGSDDVGSFTPQALNMDLAGFVSFSKGCYTGQEVVARLHYRGQSKRRLAVYQCDAARPTLSRGDKIMDGEGNAAGEVLRSEALVNEGSVLALSLRREYVGSAELMAPGQPELALDYIPLPYDTGD